MTHRVRSEAVNNVDGRVSREGVTSAMTRSGSPPEEAYAGPAIADLLEQFAVTRLEHREFALAHL